ncbi:MAG: hypothetical protein ABIQ04_04085 [Candidatus Saccharimonadales bacterium]
MNSIRSFSRQAAYLVIAAALLLTTATSALVSAAQVTERSIALSSSSISATNVTYTINFTAVQAAGAFVIDFCKNSPVIGETCTAPSTGFDVSSAASTTSGFTDVIGSTTQAVITGTIGAGAPISVALTGITNPPDAGPLYARIVTYTDKTSAQAYTSTDLNTGAEDQGGVAMYITPTVGVAGSVLESMTFCVAKNTISANCNLTGNDPPTLKLGETVGDTVALNASTVSEGTINTQISTNAASGAVVNLKNSVSCGGLRRTGASVCDIVPALQSDISVGQAKFGIKTTAATSSVGVTDASGTLQPVAGSGYNNTTYALNYFSGGASGVTSAYGDPFLDTAGAPVNNKNMTITFGASVSNNTPAGLYSADLSLVATGKF